MQASQHMTSGKWLITSAATESLSIQHLGGRFGGVAFGRGVVIGVAVKTVCPIVSVSALVWLVEEVYKGSSVVVN